MEGSNLIGHPECFVSFDGRMNISHKLDIIFYPEYRLEFTQCLYESTGFATEHRKDPFEIYSVLWSRSMASLIIWPVLQEPQNGSARIS